MTVERWRPATKITRQEELILKRCRKKRKLFVFLRENRERLLGDEVQRELEEMYKGSGKVAVPPGLMAMALIMQGYLGVSDADAVELTVVDLRWQMVLDRLGETKPAFSQGALFDFRERLIAHDMDRRILERTAEIARATKGFDAKKVPKTLRLAIDSSPLEGAGRVEDTLNLIGHAARKVVECAALLLERSFEEVCQKAGIPLLLESSVKKALDRDWSDRTQKAEAVDILSRQVLSLERWLAKTLHEEVEQPPMTDVLSVLRKLIEQDLEPDPEGGLRIREEVAKDRQISVEGREMRHGRKSQSKSIKGFKRHVAADLESKAIVACAVTPANQPEREAFAPLKDDIDMQGIRFKEAHFDRAYMSSPIVDELVAEGVAILCKPWKARNGDKFSKEDFTFDMRKKTLSCPAGKTVAFEFGEKATFPADSCATCVLREKCTSAAKGKGRTVNVLVNERLQKKMRLLSKTKAGRKKFRERVSVEHSLARISQRQGNGARYLGTRKNLFDLRRSASIQNLEITQRRAA